MTDQTRDFNILSQEFKKSNASKESINKLYDLVYELNGRKRNLEENYILASTHRLLGNRHEAKKILEKVLESCVGRQKERPLKLLQEIVHENKNFPRKDRIYRDLRDAKKIKKAPALSFDDFITRQDHEEFITSLSGNVKNIVIFNKHVETSSVNIFSKKIPDELFILNLIYYFEWLAGIKADLMAFYEKPKAILRLDMIVPLGLTDLTSGTSTSSLIIREQLKPICLYRIITIITQDFLSVSGRMSSRILNMTRFYKSFTIWLHHSWIRLLLKTLFLPSLYHHLKQ
ncbi:hypothetical protein QF023_001572 [Chryseobacterium sp. SLBN-27]|uniref:hypothetical protein n=1 Tax=Chryseobacterium sp. SLBN-27 TaxID=3042287 RepID=UPI00285DBAAA|nr:hypothetical protein [Chryseobacterium sp. SLBN-27]MDR6158056.1 hypothetical protein [Chryseobacterium sp. SLBN-27]